MLHRLSLPLIALFCTLPTSPAQDDGKKDPFVVVETSGEFQALPKGEVAEYKKRVADEYEQALDQYAARKKEASEKKEKFTEAKPKKPKVKVHGSTFDTEQEAQEYITKLREKAKDGEKKSGAKRDGTKKDGTKKDAPPKRGTPPRGGSGGRG